MQGELASGSLTMSTLSKDDNLEMSSEDSCSPDESDLELCLGLSLGGGGKPQQGPIGYARILTAKDFCYVGSSASSAAAATSSSSSSSSLSSANVAAGTKRSADSVAAANGASQVVGWPPIRTYRMNSLVHQAKSSATEVFSSIDEKSECKNIAGNVNNGGKKTNGIAKEKGQLKSSLFVKVNMDGSPIGRKVNLSAHSNYEALAHTLEDMFQGPSTHAKAIGSGGQEHDTMVGTTRPSKLLDGSFDFALTYEDKEGDWMLVGDVPWGMFLSSVKRLRIMRTSEANGLAPRLQNKNARQRCKS